MDIQIDTPKKPILKYLLISIIISLLISGVIFARNYMGEATAIVDTNDLRIAEVQQGQFSVKVKGIGSLRPKHVVWLAARVAGRVETIHLRAGALVEVGEPILQLTNPLLEQQLLNAQSILQQTIAEHKAMQANQASQLLDVQALVAKAEVIFKGNKLELDAQTRLKEMGNSSVSLLNYQRTAFSVESSELDWKIQQQKLTKLKENIQAQQQAQAAKEQSLRNALTQAQQQLDNLTVRAANAGVLQSMEVELGQELQMGSSVGKIADPNSLVAELEVQELQIKDVVLGQEVILDTRKSQIAGRVSRIDPQVINGQVLVEVMLLGDLPNEARPELSIEGTIKITDKADAIFVQKPLYAQAYKAARIFKITEQGNIAQATQVSFGQSSVNHIEVLQGLSPGDQIIVSANDNFAENQQILLHN